MTIATGAQHTLHSSPETVYGTTDATPTFTPVSHTGASLGLTKDSIEAGKLRSDRQVEDQRHGNRQAGGEIPGELEYGTYDEALEAMAMGTWSTNVLKAGTTRRSFTFERLFGNIDTPEYHRTLGGEYSEMSLNIAPNQMVEVTFTVLGQDVSTPATSIISGATYDAALDKKPFDSFTGSILEGGGAASVTSLELSWSNGLEAAFIIGDNKTIRPSVGKSRLTGTATFFFEDSDEYNKFLAETESSLSVTLTDPDASSLNFLLPRIKYNSGNPDVSGEGQVTVALEFSALYDTTEASNITITRTP